MADSFTSLCGKAEALESRELYRRAADAWSAALNLAMTEPERELCLKNTKRCALQGKYTGKPEVL